jgi:hypothetical protein
MKAVIFDVDGTLADVGHRVHHLEGEQKDWSAFFAAMRADPVIEPVARLAQILAAQRGSGMVDAVLVVTARPDTGNYKQVTEDWLAAAGIVYDGIYMRAGGDFRPDPVVKAELLQNILEDGFDPFLVVDDRPQVVAMWRSFGLVCLQCAPDEPRQSRYSGQVLLHMLIGPAGGGKSSYCAKTYKPEDVVSSDEIRRQLFGGHEDGQGQHPDDLARTWAYIHGLIRVRLENGLFTVLDATNLKASDRARVLKQVPPGVLVQYVIIDRDLDDKLADRGWRSEDLILKHHKAFKDNLSDIRNADNRGNVMVLDARQKRKPR